MPHRKRHRRRGQGTLYQRKDGRWVASLPTGTGKRLTFYGKTEREVAEHLNTALHARQQGTLSTGKQQKLKAYLPLWLEDVKRGMLKPSSYLTYQQVVRTHLVPTLGEVTLQGLTPQMVQRLYTEKQRAGLAPKTIRRIHGVLHNALEQAMKWELVARNVCTLVTLPRVERTERRTYSHEEVDIMLAAAQSEETPGGDWLAPLLTLAVTTGMRQGELLALRWSDIDFEERLVHIKRTVYRIGDTGMQESSPKSKGSSRTVMLVQRAKNALIRYREERSDQHTTLVFGWSDGRYISTAGLRWAFEKLLERAGLPRIRFHDLRHTAATLMLEAGIPMEIVQRILGHASIATTVDTYAHLVAHMQKDTLQKWGASFERKSD